MNQTVAKTIATCFGIGKIPFAPGTWGSLFGALCYWELSLLPNWFHLVFIIGTFFIGLWSIQRVSATWGVSDDQRIVIDEFVGVYLALWGANASIPRLILGFALFRLFDITKPPGVRFFDRRYFGGYGVMLDDVVAGGYTFILLRILGWFI